MNCRECGAAIENVGFTTSARLVTAYGLVDGRFTKAAEATETTAGAYCILCGALLPYSAEKLLAGGKAA